MPVPTAADEGPHAAPPADAGWQEAWWFDAWLADGSLAVACRLTHVPARRQAWYWCHLVRRDEPLVLVVDVDAPLSRSGLTVRTHGLWADHVCEAPLEQWTVANEATAVALDQPDDALGRAYGEAVPLAIDLEWYAVAPPEATASGYQQRGDVHGVIELRDGAVPLEGAAARGHEWGAVGYGSPPGRPPAGLRAPVRLPDDGVVEQVATPAGWVRWVRPLV
jgi:hypothetical protein